MSRVRWTGAKRAHFNSRNVIGVKTSSLSVILLIKREALRLISNSSPVDVADTLLIIIEYCIVQAFIYAGVGAL